MGGAMIVLPSFKWMAATDNYIPLSGEWLYRAQQWTGAVKLPGSMQAQGFGNEVTADTEWWDGPLKGVWKTSPVYEKYRQPGNVKNYEFLQPRKHYLGAAWYEKECRIPTAWKHKRILLTLERVHWQSTVHINGKEAGTQMYLSAPHEYDITELVTTGSNHISIRVDNSRLVDVGDMPHCISEQTQGTWNGIVGAIALKATDKVWIDDVQVYPDKLHITIGNITGGAVRGKVSAQGIEKEVLLEGRETRLQLDISSDGLPRWDEHHPHLHHITVQLKAGRHRDTRKVRYGIRDFSRAGTQFTVNGKPVHLRGNVDTAIFPLHGYPEMGPDWWKKLMRIHKEWGMNCIRFHSWCPPEAAFIAADEAGIYLQPECGDWSSVQTQEQFEFYKKESEAILRRYGNHPSFVTLSLGNEKSVKKEYLEYFLREWKNDNRRLYNGKTGGKPLLEGCDFYVGGGTRNGVRARYYLGWPPTPGPSYFYQFPPATTRDYTAGIQQGDRPFIAHEIAQRCAYPDVLQLPGKFTGSLQPTYLDIARDQLQELGMLEQVPDFVQASGKWQIEMYKEEIEANLRTPGIGGFHLLGLQDFPGQGTAPVGFLDFFYDAKPYVKPEMLRRCCDHTVVLARMDKRTWTNGERLDARLELYNFSGGVLQSSGIHCTVRSANGDVVHRETLAGKTFPEGAGQAAGRLSIDLKNFDAPAKYNLSVAVNDVVNDWDFWVYPAAVPAVPTAHLLIVKTLTDEALHALNEGKTVLLLPERETLKGKLVQCFGTFYWTAFDFHGGETSACGLLTDPQHPVFRHFPTDFHGNWQWWELLTQASPFILDEFAAKHPWPKSYRPLIQMVPSWKANRKMAVLAEAKVGKGRLMICSMDISTDLEKRKVAAQFRYSLLRYLLSEDFNPAEAISMEMVKGIFA
ncbi:beta-galactosidase [Chitinophaga cymbidii]|uniref:Beta-galactosidase n=2 Tax=Chitinophaga cymbidii TaxID=1096750 RepID=A0A512RJK9_9BACT|nr:beta-galactosidase [Chitinophaga cymbidii]